MYVQSLRHQVSKTEVWGDAADWKAARRDLVDVAVSRGIVKLDVDA